MQEGSGEGTACMLKLINDPKEAFMAVLK
ncbi:predicted repair protein [unidentified eubacterium SCB49]|nr:predicted repair protein [unidentified eubacterium SCB49]